jgi:hypothetical protein
MHNNRPHNGSKPISINTKQTSTPNNSPANSPDRHTCSPGGSPKKSPHMTLFNKAALEETKNEVGAEATQSSQANKSF